PEWNHQPLCQACHNQKTKWLDPATKSKRAAGGFHEEEERAANRNNWMYDADE
ncbi:HNH endonuclease, partial [Escherichia coli]|nr:HNH endonuclease [Escherichia coli]